MINSFSLSFSKSLSGVSGLCVGVGQWSTCLASNDMYATNRNVSCAPVPCRLSWRAEWNSLATIVWGDCINLFLSLDRLFGFKVGLVSLWELGQTLLYCCLSAGVCLAYAHHKNLHTSTLRAWSIKSSASPENVFSELLFEFLTESLPQVLSTLESISFNNQHIWKGLFQSTTKQILPAWTEYTELGAAKDK